VHLTYGTGRPAHLSDRHLEVADLYEKTDREVGRYWPAITATAHLLLDHGRADPHQIRTVMTTHPPGSHHARTTAGAPQPNGEDR
jgi:hypothetical protein